MLAALAASRVQGRALQDAWRRAEMAKLDAQRKESAALAAEAEGSDRDLDMLRSVVNLHQQVRGQGKV